METTAQVHARLSTLPRAALGFSPPPSTGRKICPGSWASICGSNGTT